MSEDNPRSLTPESILDKIAKDHMKQEDQRAILEEEVADYTTVINRLFSTPDGQYFLNKMLRHNGMNTFDKNINPANLVRQEGKQMVFLELIRPFLEVSILKQLDR